MEIVTEEIDKAETKREPIVFIPNDLIIDILSRLPVKTLVRFKSVCKSWQALISDLKFSFPTKGRIHAMCFTKASLMDGTFYSLDNEFVVEELPSPVGPISGDEFQLLGSCNGMLLFWSSGCTYIWNPTTRWCRELSQLNGLLSSPLHNISSGLCYDKSTDDYKAVIIDTRLVYMASLRARKIKIIDNNFPYRVPSIQITTSGILVNDHLHWVVYEGSLENWQLIVYFDERTNVFNQLPMPETVENYELIFGLGVLDGCLSMSRVLSKGQAVGNILVTSMREYGVKESWTALFALQDWVAPIFSIKSNEQVLLANTFSMGSYNTKNKKTKKICVRNNKCQNSTLANCPVTYVESVASIRWG
ncbi:hypothetical protein ACH5RR_032939 [Cinchona calisaya]|uniref:F-box domain-containing protein n=1 Tax=Cinchona calisaya TaxID=153742 RepID=A0ABD2YJI2_9GENT